MHFVYVYPVKTWRCQQVQTDTILWQKAQLRAAMGIWSC